MKITHILAALIVVSSFATQASAHERMHRSLYHHAYRYGAHAWLQPQGPVYFNSYGSYSSPRWNGPNGYSGGTRNGHNAEFGS